MNSPAVPFRTLIVLVVSLVPVAVARSQGAGTALVRHAPELAGTIEGSVQQMLAESTALRGGTVVTGDWFVPGLPRVRLDGRPNYGGTVDGDGDAEPAGYEITLGGGAALRHVIRRTNARPLPVVPALPPPPGHRLVKITSARQDPGDFASLRDLSVSGSAGAVSVPAGTYGDFAAHGNSSFILGVAGATQPARYYFQRLSLTGNGTLAVAGPVIVTVGAVSVDRAMGQAGHPEWLVLRVVGKALSLEGNSVTYAQVEIPAGTLSLRGSARLVGGASCDRLNMAGNALLQLVAAPVAHPPPVVALTAPADGAIFTTPATVTLQATAVAASGAVAKVEFFQGLTKLGEDATAPFEFQWSGVPPGTYALTARAIDGGGAEATSPVRHIVVRVGLPYFTGFEATDGYATGALDGQVEWRAAGPAVVVEDPVFRGVRALALGGTAGAGEAVHDFPEQIGQSVAYIDFWSKPCRVPAPGSGSTVSTQAARVAFADSGGLGEWFAFDGDGTGGGAWRATGRKVAVAADGRPAEWIRVTVREDYATRRWDLYVDGRLIVADLGFADGTASRLTRLTFAGAAGAVSGVDDLYAGLEHPLFVDADQDGLDDAWEIQNGLNPAVNDRAGDLDGDGLSNLQEFQLGLRANAVDSEGDGMPDSWEVRYALDPLTSDGNADLDGDGVGNLQEYFLGRNPTKGAVADATGAVNLRLFSPIP